MKNLCCTTIFYYFCKVICTVVEKTEKIGRYAREAIYSH